MRLAAIMKHYRINAITNPGPHQNVPRGPRASILLRCYTYIASDGDRVKVEFNIPHFGYRELGELGVGPNYLIY
jgi:hypothetical protein